MTNARALRNNWIWDRYWRLIIVEQLWGKWKILCRCDCGTERIMYHSNLVRWLTKSCWCLNKEIMKEKFKTHWMRQTQLYKKRKSMKNRCTNPKCDHYNSYGWRGIKCLWKSFEEFRDDMYQAYLDHIEEYWEIETTIEREDVNWNYCKENCRRATREEQRQNKR